MLDCKHVLAELSDYLDASVSPEVKKALEEHLTRCHRCSLIYNTARRSLEIVTDAGPFEVPLEVSARLYARLRERLALSH